MSHHPIVGSIVERKTSSFTTPRASSSTKTGFPAVQHRSKSAFSRHRDELRKFGSTRSKGVPTLLIKSPPPAPVELNYWREQISRDNEERVAQMTDEEREEEQRQILERFGENVGEILRRARLSREKMNDKVVSEVVEAKPTDVIPVIAEREERRSFERAQSPPPSALASHNSTRPSSRADRRLRFAELEPQDVHVYESAPSSPKRKALPLPPAKPGEDTVVSLGQWKGKLVAPDASTDVEMDTVPQPVASEPEEPEEGSAEYIRRRYFPLAPKDDPNLAWMDVDPSPSEASTSSLRFDLHGNPIPTSLSLTLPTHLGLHHHAEGSRAGYTLDDIFLLSRSTVPSQRATMLGVMAGVAHRIQGMNKGKVDGMEEILGKEKELRKRILAAGLEAISEKGSVGARAIEVVWHCIVGWDPEEMDLEGVELEHSSDSSISSVPLEFFLPQVTNILTLGNATPESSSQLLFILHRLAQENNTIATTIVSTPKLLAAVLQTFLLTPIAYDNSSPLPNPLALQLFYTLVLSSRDNAREVEKLSDSLLRFVTFSPFDSPYPQSLAISLLVLTLRLYRALASYGLYCHIAGTAVAQLSHIEQHVISEACTSMALTVAWVELVEAWSICAIDPHQTTPDHDILWSQVIGWSWNIGISELRERLTVDEKDWMAWTASWKAQAAWLEGSKINAIKGGENERLEFIDAVKSGFEGGNEHKIVLSAATSLYNELNNFQSGDPNQLKRMVQHVQLLATVIRLWLACLPPHWEGVPSSPPIVLPFPQLSEISRTLLVHPLWSQLLSSESSLGYLYCREFSGYFTYFLRLSKHLPGTSQSLWMTQAFSMLLRMCPGDEVEAQSIVNVLISLLTPDWAADKKLNIPSVIWERGGLSILLPFLMNRIQPQREILIGPIISTPRSIKVSTTQRIPALSSLKLLGLPLHGDWSLSALDHLLRSGDSVVFKSLPPSWDSSETEVVRASLLLAKIVQEVLMNLNINPLILTREEAAFGCMKIFMLEHGQPENGSEEVFRDEVVNHLMEDLLQPYIYGEVETQSAINNREDIEIAAAKFLGPSVPFYQFYTDFVSLYDAISFSHPLFSLLLLFPISMRYPLDYRKHLWCDFNHVVKTIHIAPSQVLSADIREYLYPIEADPQIIASYLSSLLKDNVVDFMRLVAIHHIAANIWPDLWDGGGIKNEDRACILLKTIVDQGSTNVVREITRYRQLMSGRILLPPICFDDVQDVSSLRLNCIASWGGQTIVNRLAELLKAS